MKKKINCIKSGSFLIIRLDTLVYNPSWMFVYDNVLIKYTIPACMLLDIRVRLECNVEMIFSQIFKPFAVSFQGQSLRSHLCKYNEMQLIITFEVHFKEPVWIYTISVVCRYYIQNFLKIKNSRRTPVTVNIFLLIRIITTYF